MTEMPPAKPWETNNQNNHKPQSQQKDLNEKTSSDANLVPQRPASLPPLSQPPLFNQINNPYQNYSIYNNSSAYSTPYYSSSAYSSGYPYSAGVGGYQRYGGSYGGVGYSGGYGSYGNSGYYGSTNQQFGSYSGNALGAAQSPLLTEYHNAFQFLDRIVHCFGSFAHMLDTTLMATHSSYMAMMGLAEQYSHLKRFLADLFGFLSLYSFVSKYFRQLSGNSSSLTREFVESSQGKSSVAKTGSASSSRRPIIVFLLVAFGAPILLSRLLNLLKSKSLPGATLSSSDSSTASSNPSVSFARALYDFDAQSPQEISFKKGDLLAVISNESNSEWCRGKLRHGNVGFFPRSYVEVLATPSANSTSTPAPSIVNLDSLKSHSFYGSSELESEFASAGKDFKALSFEE